MAKAAADGTACQALVTRVAAPAEAGPECHSAGELGLSPGGAGLGHRAASSQFQGLVPGTALEIISGDSPTLKSHLVLPSAVSLRRSERLIRLQPPPSLYTHIVGAQ